MKNYFFRSEEINGKIKIFPMSNQTDETGNKINESLCVSCNTSIKCSIPAPGYFVGSSLTLSSSGKFYRCFGDFRVLESTKPEAFEMDSICGTSYSKKIETFMETLKKDKTLHAPTSKDDGFYMSDNDWNLLIRNIKRHVNTMIIGVTGCGKTSCVKQACDRLGLPLHTFDMGSMIDPISSLLGVHRLEDGKSIFDYAKFTQVIQEPCVILLDELNRASLACNNVLFPCLDDRRKLSIEIACGKGIREIKVHPEVTFIATANIGSEYSGTQIMDKALVNRFFPLELGLIPSKEEEQVLCKRTGIDIKSSEMIVKVANNIRSLSKKEEISSSLSIRETLMVANLVSDGWDLGKAMEMVYLPLYEGSSTEGERGTVYKTISTY